MTLVELVITMVVISIIGGIAFSKISSPAALTIGQQADLFSNQIRHAQSLAQTWGCQLTLIVSTTGYEVRNKNIVTGKTKCSSANTIIKDPSTNQNFTTTLKHGVLFSAPAIGTFDFDIKGIPTDNATGIMLANPVTYTMNASGKTYTISISNITGFVSVTSP